MSDSDWKSKTFFMGGAPNSPLENKLNSSKLEKLLLPGEPGFEQYRIDLAKEVIKYFTLPLEILRGRPENKLEFDDAGLPPTVKAMRPGGPYCLDRPAPEALFNHASYDVLGIFSQPKMMEQRHMLEAQHGPWVIKRPDNKLADMVFRFDACTLSDPIDDQEIRHMVAMSIMRSQINEECRQDKILALVRQLFAEKIIERVREQSHWVYPPKNQCFSTYDYMRAYRHMLLLARRIQTDALRGIDRRPSIGWHIRVMRYTRRMTPNALKGVHVANH